MRHRICRRTFLAFLLFLPPVLTIACHGHDHVAGKRQFKLAPRSKKTIKFKADHETTVSFKTDISPSQRKKLKKNGIRLIYQNRKGEGEIVTSPDHGSLQVVPEKGKVSVKLENLESFSIPVTVTWK